MGKTKGAGGEGQALEDNSSRASAGATGGGEESWERADPGLVAASLSILAHRAASEGGVCWEGLGVSRWEACQKKVRIRRSEAARACNLFKRSSPERLNNTRGARYTAQGPHAATLARMAFQRGAAAGGTDLKQEIFF